MVANMYKKRIKFYLKIYFKILVQDLKSKMNYRSDFIISLIGMIFTNIVGFISFGILFSKFPTINGWNYYEILFLYGFSLVSLTPVQCFFDNNWNLRKYVYSGDFIFENTIGRCDMPGGNYKQMQESIKYILENYQELEIYPGHGNKTYLSEEIPQLKNNII